MVIPPKHTKTHSGNYHFRFFRSKIAQGRVAHEFGMLYSEPAHEAQNRTASRSCIWTRTYTFAIDYGIADHDSHIQCTTTSPKLNTPRLTLYSAHIYIYIYIYIYICIHTWYIYIYIYIYINNNNNNNNNNNIYIYIIYIAILIKMVYYHFFVT